MKTIAAAALLLASFGLAHADQPGSNWIGFSTITQNLEAAGYSDIRKVEADDGYWKVRAMKDRHLFKILLDPYAGAIV